MLISKLNNLVRSNRYKPLQLTPLERLENDLLCSKLFENLHQSVKSQMINGLRLLSKVDNKSTKGKRKSNNEFLLNEHQS